MQVSPFHNADLFMKATAPARLLAIEVGLVPCGARAQFLLACGTRAGIVAALFADRFFSGSWILLLAPQYFNGIKGRYFYD